ncbi:tRNA (adenosine(37)-N6)-threonylcarbamoyltransferase complex transferase subunit TsaD [Patescibacteria group bacterium]|nr:tRNA (adenosine(37)-N6)-threonylcarbamoyltransferase complex transferase subunit TsaD [Patescibacteria group bacterium]MBU1124042.1 tRNA (adenosine(37)-N6)-threonylcarbamoyltransferase complex transferase subunit TsaD [Patescibacteria group bacterium]MBU1911253.1 tRNA (adenosine(37)-N6)-threonylcarbamoyltransferase complex transferase subunit TsaD [Patescibacteria group bacterium]
MRILAIETSCDETSAAVVEDGRRVLSNIIASSKDAFSDSGGVIPEEAARKQVESIQPVINQALEKAGLSIEKIDAIAVTKCPGLLVSLLVGATVARTLASIHKKPLIGVHHTLGHLSSTWLDQLDEPKFPILTLSASGGHSELWLRSSHTKGELLGSTRDDAAGEAFDKGASMLGLPYPGGPSIFKAAEKGNIDSYEFPNPLHDDETLDFSFSGLKTALKYLLRDLSKVESRKSIVDCQLSNVASSYQHAICRHLVSRIDRAVKKYPELKEVHLVGGVSANIHLRKLAEESIKPVLLRTPIKIVYCTDHAAMIGSAAFFMQKEMGEKAYDKFETEASIPSITFDSRHAPSQSHKCDVTPLSTIDT